MSYAVPIPPTRHRGTKRILDRAPTANPVPAVLVPPFQAAIFDPFGQPCSATPASVLFNGSPIVSFTRAGNVLTLTGLTTSRTAAPRQIDSLNLHLTKADGTDTDATNAPSLSTLTVNGLARGWTMDAAGAVALTAWAHGPRTAAPRTVDATHLQLTNADGVDLGAANAPLLASLTRTDWQGTNLLSPNPRTNKFTYSTFAGATGSFPTGWGITGVVNSNNTKANDGSLPSGYQYNEIRLLANSGLQGFQANPTPVLTANIPASIICMVRIPTGLSAMDLSIYTGTGTPSMITVATAATLNAQPKDVWVRYVTTFTPTVVGSVISFTCPAPAIGLGCDITAPSLGSTSDIGDFIPTTTAPVTLTDYVHTNGTVTLAQTGGTYSGTWSYTGGLEAGETVSASWTYQGPLVAGDSIGVNW